MLQNIQRVMIHGSGAMAICAQGAVSFLTKDFPKDASCLALTISHSALFEVYSILPSHLFKSSRGSALNVKQLLPVAAATVGVACIVKGYFQMQEAAELSRNVETYGLTEQALGVISKFFLSVNNLSFGATLFGKSLILLKPASEKKDKTLA